MVGNYTVGVIGGAVAGSEIAARLADAGMEVAVFEQNALPYGKIEDGLPRWHKKMQDKECASIDAKLDRPEIHFVPHCRLGRDVTPQELIEDWGFQMVVLANGAWRDRPLALPGATELDEDSLIYQNAFVYWFNHYEDRNYAGPRYQVPAGATVIGGGLASLDMVKVLQFEVIKNALAERGIACDIVEMEHHGIHATLEHHGLSYAGLGLQPARLFYRKRISDMPLMPLGDDPTPEKLEKAEKVREKLMANAMHKFGFEVYPLHVPVALKHTNGKLVAVVFERYRYENGRFLATGEQVSIETALLISSIGSLPEELKGIPMEGEHYHWEDKYTGQLAGMQQFYCVGNAITGRGNIEESLQNARRLGQIVASAVTEESVDYAALFREQEQEARIHVARLLEFLATLEPADSARRSRLHAKLADHYGAIGFDGYASWRNRALAARLHDQHVIK